MHVQYLQITAHLGVCDDDILYKNYTISLITDIWKDVSNVIHFWGMKYLKEPKK